jgi:hypothetical protein
MSIDKKASKFLPQDVQDAINTFITQTNIIEEYDLDYMPPEYSINLLKTLGKYPEFISVAFELMNILSNDKN